MVDLLGGRGDQITLVREVMVPSGQVLPCPTRCVTAHTHLSTKVAMMRLQAGFVDSRP